MQASARRAAVFGQGIEQVREGITSLGQTVARGVGNAISNYRRSRIQRSLADISGVITATRSGQIDQASALKALNDIRDATSDPDVQKAANDAGRSVVAAVEDIEDRSYTKGQREYELATRPPKELVQEENEERGKVLKIAKRGRQRSEYLETVTDPSEAAMMLSSPSTPAWARPGLLQKVETANVPADSADALTFHLNRLNAYPIGSGERDSAVATAAASFLRGEGIDYTGRKEIPERGLELALQDSNLPEEVKVAARDLITQSNRSAIEARRKTATAEKAEAALEKLGISEQYAVDVRAMIDDAVDMAMGSGLEAAQRNPGSALGMIRGRFNTDLQSKLLSRVPEDRRAAVAKYAGEELEKMLRLDPMLSSLGRVAGKVNKAGAGAMRPGEMARMELSLQRMASGRLLLRGITPNNPQYGQLMAAEVQQIKQDPAIGQAFGASIVLGDESGFGGEAPPQGGQAPSDDAFSGGGGDGGIEALEQALRSRPQGR